LNVTINGHLIHTDVTAAKFAFWNDGSRSIRSENILQPLVVQTASKTRILQASLEKKSRDVTGIRIDTTQLDTGRVAIDWTILEEGDGGVVQLIYEGDENVFFTGQATIEGQRKLSVPPPFGKVRKWPIVVLYLIYVPALLGVLICTMIWFKWLKYTRKEKPFLRLMLPPMLLMFVLHVLSAYVASLLRPDSVPPFGF
jgi:hypothetical protein